MRAVIQRVLKAGVRIEGSVHSEINLGLLVFVGVEDADNESDVKWLCSKIVGLRIFDDEEGVMNRSVKDIGGQILVVSQFTLHASTQKGNRPSYIRASKPDKAIPLYEMVLQEFESLTGKSTPAGIFGADMKVELINDGPVTILIDTKRKE